MLPQTQPVEEKAASTTAEAAAGTDGGGTRREEKESLPEKVLPKNPEEKAASRNVSIPDIPYEQMTVEQLQTVILEKMAKNGPVTEQMKKDVRENIWQNSLINWARSF